MTPQKAPQDLQARFQGETFDSTLEENMVVLATMDRYYDWLASLIKPWAGRRVLEAGCGAGNLTRFFMDRDFVLGLDVHRAPLEKFRRRFASLIGRGKAGTVMADIGAARTPRGLKKYRFDTVISSNTLEHVRDDRRALRHVAALLRPGGRLCLIVPAMPRLYSLLDFLIGHFRRYSLRELRGKAEEAGFRILKARYLNLPGAVGWLVTHRLFRRRSFPAGQFRLFNLLAPVFRAVENVVTFPLGMSILLIAEKK